MPMQSLKVAVRRIYLNCTILGQGSFNMIIAFSFELDMIHAARLKTKFREKKILSVRNDTLLLKAFRYSRGFQKNTEN